MFLRRARRRHLLLIAVDEGAVALAIAFVGAIVLLVTGTQLLNWYWLAGLCVAAGVAIAVRARKKILPPYTIAQIADRNLKLNDTLSTALYFSGDTERIKPPAGVIDRQRRMADELAGSLDPRQAVPFAFSRSAYVSGGLAIVAITVFGLRYGVTRTMDLRPSLAQIAFDGLIGPQARTAEARTKSTDPRAQDWQNPASLKEDPWQAQTVDQNGTPDGLLNTVDTPNVDNSKEKGPASEAKSNGPESQNSPQAEGETPDGSDRGGSAKDAAPDGAQAPSNEGGNAAKNQAAGQDGKGGNTSSLTDKMRDALANLLSKFKMQPKDGGSSGKTGQQGQTGAQMAQNRQSKDQNGSQGQGKPQSDSTASANGQQSQEGQGQQQAQAAQGKSDGTSNERSDSRDGKSGIGKQDGDKSIKEAEELAAMGKISEILGKRAQNISGEVMVEVASGNQQLRTQYTNRKAAHSDAGAEITRDEIPLAYQQYVQQYFEAIRKQPADAGKTAKKP